MKKRIISALTAVMCVLSAAAALPSASAEKAGRNFTYKGTLPVTGDKLTILCWGSDYADSMLEMWLKDTGYTAEQVNVVSFDTGGSGALECYEKYLKGGQDADIIFAEPDWALKLLGNDTMAVPLSELGFDDSDFADQYSYAREQGKDSNGVLKGVSFGVAPGVWCYRTDLAEKYLNVKTPEEMQEKVKSVNIFADTCIKLSDATGRKTAMTATLDGLFTAARCQRPQAWVVDGKLNPELSDSRLSQLAMAERALKSGDYVTDKGMWTDEWISLGQTDETMGYFVSSWGFETMLLSAAGGVNGATYGKWGVCEGPMPYYWGGVMMCVHPKTDNADMAADFIDYFTVNKETMKKYALEGKNGMSYLPNSMTVVQELINEGTDRDKTIDDLLGGQERLKVLDRNARAYDLSYKNITVYDSEIETALYDALSDYCDGVTMTDKDFIADFKSRAFEVINGSKRGDVSGNGKIDIQDAIAIAKHIMGVKTLSNEKKNIADFNDDGKVTIQDVIGIAKYMIHKPK